MEFKRSYEQVFHALVSVYCGLLFPHKVVENKSDAPVNVKWRAIKVRLEVRFAFFRISLFSYLV